MAVSMAQAASRLQERDELILDALEAVGGELVYPEGADLFTVTRALQLPADPSTVRTHLLRLTRAGLLRTRASRGRIFALHLAEMEGTIG
jgi:DNA-binding IclR family transcriptional regulator